MLGGRDRVGYFGFVLRCHVFNLLCTNLSYNCSLVFSAVFSHQILWRVTVL